MGQISLCAEGVYHVNSTSPSPIYKEIFSRVKSPNLHLPQTFKKTGERHRRAQTLNRRVHITCIPKIFKS